MEARNQRSLMYVATHGTDDPTLATLPFLVATGAGSAEIDCCIALVGEAASLVKPGMIDAVHGVGSRRSANSRRRLGISRYQCTSEALARSPVG
jgi:predicted peroxiredoxin